MTPIEVLLKVRDKINSPSKWCSYWHTSKDSKRYGVDGAVWFFAGLNSDLSNEVIALLAEHSNINSMWKPYDRVVYVGPHKEVMRMVDETIEELLKVKGD